MQMISFTDIDELNQFLAEKKEDQSVYIKSVKTICVKNTPHFFVLTDEKTYRDQNYNKRYPDSRY